MTLTVLDASALLAFAAGEPGADRVEAALGDAVVAAPNWTEYLSVMARRGADIEQARGLVLALGPRVVSCDREDAEHGARIVAPAGGLALGDRLCLGTAITLDAPVLTADRAWSTLDVPIPVELIRGEA